MHPAPQHGENTEQMRAFQSNKTFRKKKESIASVRLFIAPFLAYLDSIGTLWSLCPDVPLCLSISSWHKRNSAEASPSLTCFSLYLFQIKVKEFRDGEVRPFTKRPRQRGFIPYLIFPSHRDTHPLSLYPHSGFVGVAAALSLFSSLFILCSCQPHCCLGRRVSECVLLSSSVNSHACSCIYSIKKVLSLFLFSCHILNGWICWFPKGIIETWLWYFDFDVTKDVLSLTS